MRFVCKFNMLSVHAQIRGAMQRSMQDNAAVYRTGSTLKVGVEQINAIVDTFGDVKVTDRSLIWNSDLVETLELQNLLAQVILHSHKLCVS